jgi:hypothetical protein
VAYLSILTATKDNFHIDSVEVTTEMPPNPQSRFLCNAPGHHDLGVGSRSDFSEYPLGYSTKPPYSP